MILTITTTHRPATDLGFLLHKNPARAQSFELPAGTAHVFYPEANEDRCTVALLVELDPVALVRSRRVITSRQYVNDRPYAASSFLSAALLKVFGSAMAGSSRDRPELAASSIPLEVTIPVLAANHDEGLLRRIFEPLGYEVSATPHELDGRFPDWGMSDYFSVNLAGRQRLSTLLEHLYVLIPTLDEEKHYWIAKDEVDKLLNRGGSWLANHPERDLIVRRYLKGLRTYTTEALERLIAEEGPAEHGDDEQSREHSLEARLSLGEQRMNAVLHELKASGARRVLDLGCGEGRLLRLLLEAGFDEIVGMDISIEALQKARGRLGLDRMPEARRARLRLLHSSLVYRDKRLTGFDAAAAVEVIEHLDPFRLRSFERAVFEFASPATLVVTTPNRDYNRLFPTLPSGDFRHEDHRFEWSPEEFEAWARPVAAKHGYTVRFEPVGEVVPDAGPPTQMAVFSK